MIIVKLKGGLGNQLFEYAFARSLSYNLNNELYLDLSYFNHNHRHPNHLIYGLHSFNIKGIVGSYPYLNLNAFNKIINSYKYFEKIPFVKNISLFNNIYTFLNNHGSQSLNYIREPSYFEYYTFDRECQSSNFIKGNTYLDGGFQHRHDSKNRLWMSDYYFEKNIDLIHEDLKYLAELTDESAKIVNDMNNHDSILLHVRHGDFVGLLDYGLCSKEYYQKSIDAMLSKVDNPKFFIFSNDIEWTKNNLKIEAPHEFVDFKDNPELVGRGTGELLKLMSSCNHFITANSTLSWWAAFLGEDENKIIITPTPWYQSRRIMGADKIDNLKPVSISNNHEATFNDSKIELYHFNENNAEFNNLEYEKIGKSIKIKKINENSNIILKNNSASEKQFIIKLGLESNYFNCFKILFKTDDNNNYSNDNTFNIFYYDEDKFNHYLIFPRNANLDEIKIIPGHPNDNENNYIIINSLEINEIDNTIKY